MVYKSSVCYVPGSVMIWDLFNIFDVGSFKSKFDIYYFGTKYCVVTNIFTFMEEIHGGDDHATD